VAEEERPARFVDANIFIRALTDDSPSVTADCVALFDRADREEVGLFTSEAIIAEVIYVLTSPRIYRVRRAEAATKLRPFLLCRALTFDHKASILAALELYEASNLSFEDCLAVQHVLREKLDGIYSYDRGFRPALGLARHEP
jgi:predicted nucleic acid-binding protein